MLKTFKVHGEASPIEYNLEGCLFEIGKLLQQELIILVSKKLNAGSFNYSWDADDLLKGVYRYKLSAGAYPELIK